MLVSFPMWLDGCVIIILDRSEIIKYVKSRGEGEDLEQKRQMRRE